jgi:hypothetical protein
MDERGSVTSVDIGGGGIGGAAGEGDGARAVLVVCGVERCPADDDGRETSGWPPVRRVVPVFMGADVVLDRCVFGAVRGVYVAYGASWGRCRRFGSRSGRGNDLLDRELLFVLVLGNARVDVSLLAEGEEEDPGAEQEGTECFL